MYFRSITSTALAAALVVGQVGSASADAGDFIGGAIVGGLIGHAITKDQQQKKRTTTTRVYRPGIPSTTQGAQTQTALNYFGYNAGRVDGQVGPGTRRAIESYQASMGYPVNGRDFQPYQYDFLMQAYHWAQSGGQVQSGLAGQPLLLSYRQKVQSGTLYTTAPQGVAPSTTTVVVAAPAAAPEPVEEPVEVAAEEPAGSSLPTLFSGGSGGKSLANRCNGVMLQTSTNGGYTTLDAMSDPDFALSEQFCLARSFSIAKGEELLAQVQGLSPQQIAEQCNAFGEMLKPQVDAVSLRPQAEAESGMRDFALTTGIAPADLAATSRVCLSVGYSQDNMPMAVGSALMLSTMGEPGYGELLGHHLREGYGTAQRVDLAMQWYQSSLSAIEAGSAPVLVPTQPDRPILLREATIRLQSGQQQGSLTTPNTGSTTAALPTFKVAQ